MGNSLFAYLERLEMLGFFSGFPLIYAIIFAIKGNRKTEWPQKLPLLLPYSYALVGLLYLGLQARNLYPDYSAENINQLINQPYLKAWAIISIFLWVPPLGRRPVLSLLHSLVFFFFVARDLFLHSIHSADDKLMIRNDMSVYTDSLLLNLGTFIFVLLISFLVTWRKTRKRSPTKR